jgi:hypothetical protein
MSDGRSHTIAEKKKEKNMSLVHDFKSISERQRLIDEERRKGVGDPSASQEAYPEDVEVIALLGPDTMNPLVEIYTIGVKYRGRNLHITCKEGDLKTGIQAAIESCLQIQRSGS